MSTTIEPITLFNLIKEVPGLFNAFRDECYTYPLNSGIDDPKKEYNHDLGIAFLKKHGIPTTTEELEQDRLYIYEPVISGRTAYNAGQFFIVYPNVVHSNLDLVSNEILIAEVMTDIELPADEVVQSITTNNIEQALSKYIENDSIRLHKTGMRMFKTISTYQFADRINNA